MAEIQLIIVFHSDHKRGVHTHTTISYGEMQYTVTDNYFKLPRQTIRENANFICLFPHDLKNLNHIFHDHVGSDMTKEEFRQYARQFGKSNTGL